VQYFNYFLLFAVACSDDDEFDDIDSNVADDSGDDSDYIPDNPVDECDDLSNTVLASNSPAPSNSVVPTPPRRPSMSISNIVRSTSTDFVVSNTIHDLITVPDFWNLLKEVL